ncbi:MAG: hypothetical protein RR220_07245 [Bacteroidaceae bacterium]
MKSIKYKKRNIQALLMIICLGCWGLTSCSDDDEMVSAGFGFSEEDSEVTMPNNGGTYSLKLAADKEWVAESNVEWCMVTPANGEGSTVCELRVDTSYLYKSRDAMITFRSGNKSRQVHIFQYGFEKIIKLEKDLLEVADFIDYEKMFAELKVTSNVKYEIVPQDANTNTNWVKITMPDRKIGSVPHPEKIRFDFEIYTQSDIDREIKYILRQTDAKEGEKPVEVSFTFRQKKAQQIIPSREGDSLALLAVSRSLKCYYSWDTSQSMIYWDNVRLEEVTYRYKNGNIDKDSTEYRVVGMNFYVFNTDNTVPYQIRYLNQLKTLAFTGNENSYLKSIKLEDDITYLDSLRSLAFMGYGINSLPARMTNLKKLEDLELSGNALQELPMDIIESLDKDSLIYLSITANRHHEIGNSLYANKKDSIGLGGQLPERLFKLKHVQYIHLSYNYFEGSIPDFGGKTDIMPQLKKLGLNLNYFTGRIPEWILQHKRLKCWDPYTLIFNQTYNGKDSNNKKVGFDNVPDFVDRPCPDWEENEETEGSSKLTMELMDKNFKWVHYFDRKAGKYPKLSLKGHWAE